MNNNEYFGGVARAELYDIDTGDLAINANSLTESTFTVGSESTEVRGGQGYFLEGKYYHTTSVSFNLTDSLYRQEYVAAKVGSTIEYGADMMEITKLKVTGNKLTLPSVPQEFDGKLIAWVKTIKESDWHTKQITKVSETEYTVDYIAEDDTEICVKYVKFDENVKKVTINANFVPSTYHLKLYVQRFSGQKYVGETVIDVPLFQLDPSFELSMSANGVSTMAVAGSALPVEDFTTCDSNKRVFCTIIDKTIDGKWTDDASQLVAYPPTLELTTDEKASVMVRALFNSNLIVPKLVDKEDLTFSIPVEKATIATVDDKGIVTAVGSGDAHLTITSKDRPELTETVVITVA